MIRRGSRGESVAAVQRLFKYLGYRLKVDGIFGSETEKVVRDFQTKNDIAVDGIVGVQTLSLLLSQFLLKLQTRLTRTIRDLERYKNTLKNIQI